MNAFSHRKATQALNFFAGKEGGAINKMKALKLMWLSDRLHLMRFGRMITNDTYFAFKNGPVASGTRDLLESSSFLPEANNEYASAYIATTNQYEFKSLKDPEMMVFSRTDISVMDTIYSTFGTKNQFQLSDFSHIFPEWKRFESSLMSGSSNRHLIEISDLFVPVPDDSGLFDLDVELCKDTKAVFTSVSERVKAIGI